MSQNAYDYSFELRKARQKKITKVFLVCLSAFLSITLFLSLILFPLHISSSSMETNVSEGGCVFVCPFLRNPSRGQIVYLSRMDREKLSSTQKFLNSFFRFFTLQQYEPFGRTARMTGNCMVRRVAALPGDTFYMKDYVLYVKPAGQTHYLTEFELSSKPYDIHIYSVPVEWDGMGCPGNFAERTLKEREYFLLADDRIEAVDSRVFGPVEASRIKGRVVCQYLPFNKLRLF